MYDGLRLTGSCAEGGLYSSELLLEIDASVSRLRQPIDRIHHQVKAIHVVQNCHVERRGNRALFFVATNMNVK